MDFFLLLNISEQGNNALLVHSISVSWCNLSSYRPSRAPRFYFRIQTCIWCAVVFLQSFNLVSTLFMVTEGCCCGYLLCWWWRLFCDTSRFGGGEKNNLANIFQEWITTRLLRYFQPHFAQHNIQGVVKSICCVICWYFLLIMTSWELRLRGRVFMRGVQGSVPEWKNTSIG